MSHDEMPANAREAGFTLIEMMVALAIFSLVALTLLKLEGTIVRNSGEISTQALGQIVAHNMAVETLTDPRPPALGEEEGVTDNGGRLWNWRRTAALTADPPCTARKCRITPASAACAFQRRR